VKRDQDEAARKPRKRSIIGWAYRAFDANSPTIPSAPRFYTKIDKEIYRTLSNIFQWVKNSLRFFLIRFGTVFLISFLIPFALYLQQFETRTCQFCLVLAKFGHVHLPFCTVQVFATF
jgi:hypothetical protein